MNRLKRIKRLKWILLAVQICLPLLLMLLSASMLIMMGQGKSSVRYETGMQVSEDVFEYRQLVTEMAEKYGVSEYVYYLLAIMQVESGGQGVDVMQSLAYSGLLEEVKTPEISIEYGVAYFADLVKRALRRRVHRLCCRTRKRA